MTAGPGALVLGDNGVLIDGQRVVVQHAFDQGSCNLAGYRFGAAGATAGKPFFHGGIEQLHPAVVVRGRARQRQMRGHRPGR